LGSLKEKDIVDVGDKFHVWDIAGHEEFAGLRDGYYVNAQAGIIMDDQSNRGSYGNAMQWYNGLRAICKDIPIVVCGNQCDKKHWTDGLFSSESEIRHLPLKNISAKTLYHADRPFIYLARVLLEDNLLVTGPTTQSPGPTNKLANEVHSGLREPAGFGRAGVTGLRRPEIGQRPSIDRLFWVTRIQRQKAGARRPY
jgi:hypothetical protein